MLKGHIPTKSSSMILKSWFSGDAAHETGLEISVLPSHKLVY